MIYLWPVLASRHSSTVKNPSRVRCPSSVRVAGHESGGALCEASSEPPGLVLVLFPKSRAFLLKHMAAGQKHCVENHVVTVPSLLMRNV